MLDPTDKFSAVEAAAAARVFDALVGLDAGQVERVLSHVQRQLAPDESAPLFARGIAGPLGKLDTSLRTKVDEMTAEQFLRHCAQQGADTSTMLRDCVYVLVYGRSYRQMVVERINHDAKRTEALALLIAPFGSPELGGFRP